VDIRFLPPDLRRLDEANAEVAVGTFWQDERPMRGLAGLLDWRLAGRLSALLVSGWVRGDDEEVLLVPGKPHLPFEKVLLVGLGPRDTFGEETFRRSVVRMTQTLEGLRVRRAVVELPGRGVGAIDPERAITIALECLGKTPEHDAWWLVEEPAAQKVVELRVRSSQRVASILEP
jgi:hypothetical protein